MSDMRFNFRQEQVRKLPDRLPGPVLPPIQSVPGLKRWRLQADHSPPSSSKVKKVCVFREYLITHKANLTLTLLYLSLNSKFYYRVHKTQSFWLQIQRSRVRFPALPDFLTSRGPGTGSTQPRDHN
jgi:hypothetical protein